MFYKRTSFLYIVSVFLLPVAIESVLLTCKEEGRFSVPSDCGSFIDCVRRNDTGDLEARKGSCGKGGFHPKERRCVSLKKLKGCGNRRARLDLKRHDLNHLCSGGSDFVCADCNTLVHCLDGVAFAQSCAPGDLCQVKENFGGAVCYPEFLPKCSCGKSNIFRKDPYDKRTFYFCDNYALPTFYKCSEEMVFDLNIEQCVNEHGLPPCTKIGVFADHDDCRNYYTCIQSERGWVQKLFTCPGLTMYSEVNSKCEDPCKWYKGAFECAEEGRFRDRTNCQAFYECISTDDGFRKTKRLCPSGFFWEQSGNSNSGNCINKEDSQCDSLTPTTCDVPPDWCEFDVGKQPFPDLEDQDGDYDYIDYVELKTQVNQTEASQDSKTTENSDSSKVINVQTINKEALSSSPFITSLSNSADTVDPIKSELALNNKDNEQYNFKINANKYVVLRGNNKYIDDSLLDIIHKRPESVNPFGTGMNIRENDRLDVNDEPAEAFIKLESNKNNYFEINDNAENSQNGEVFIPIVRQNVYQKTEEVKDNELNIDKDILETEHTEVKDKDNIALMNIDNDTQKQIPIEHSTSLPVVTEVTTIISDIIIEPHDNIYNDISESSQTDNRLQITLNEGTETTKIKENENMKNEQDNNTTSIPSSDSEIDQDVTKYLHGHGYIDKTTIDDDHQDSAADFPNIFSAYGESLKFGSSEDYAETEIVSHSTSAIPDSTTSEYNEIEIISEGIDDSFVVTTTNRNLNDYNDDDSENTTPESDLSSNNDFDYDALNTKSFHEPSINGTSNNSTTAADDLIASTQNSISDDQSPFDQTDDLANDSVTEPSANSDADLETALDQDLSFEEEPHMFTLGDEVPNLNRILF